jgi:hypothetical protein
MITTISQPITLISLILTVWLCGRRTLLRQVSHPSLSEPHSGGSDKGSILPFDLDEVTHVPECAIHCGLQGGA